jgi:hypothetical protein
MLKLLEPANLSSVARSRIESKNETVSNRDDSTTEANGFNTGIPY